MYYDESWIWVSPQNYGIPPHCFVFEWQNRMIIDIIKISAIII
jgi:hypothetical protein